MVRSAALVEQFVASDAPVYGVTTGFGSLANTAIPPERTAELQLALVRSHATGLGDTVEREVVRAMLLLRARSLAMARSGARPEIVDLQLALLANDLVPVVREHGSLGASGDLAPLAHCALALIGEGQVWEGGEVRATAPALAEAGLSPVSLRAKEGLALINGTDGMLGMLCLAVHDLTALFGLADVVAAMSVEALLGTDRAFAPDLQELRPQVGQAASARNLMRLLADSEIVASHRDWRQPRPGRLLVALHAAGARRRSRCPRLCQNDRRARARCRDRQPDDPSRRARRELRQLPRSAGGDGVRLPVDRRCRAVARSPNAAPIACSTPARSHGLPPFLSEDAGVNSGLMIAHYTQAAMALENQRLAVPSSTQSLPTSAMQEDHVSNGWAAARKLRRSVDNLRRVLAVELVCAAAGLDLRAPLHPAPATAAARDVLRAAVPPPGADRWLSPDLLSAERLLADGSVLGAVESAIGALEVV